MKTQVHSRWRFRWYSYHDDQWLDKATPQLLENNQHQSIPQSSLASLSKKARSSAKNSSRVQTQNKRTGNIELQDNRTPFSVSGSLLCLAAVTSAKRILQAVGKDTFSTKDYYLNRRGETMTIDALDGRGEIARISDGVVTGNVSATDISNLNDLEKTVGLKQMQSQQQRLNFEKPNSSQEWEIGD